MIEDVSARFPGVYWEDEYPVAPRRFSTGVPAFLGFTNRDAGPASVSRYAQFAAQFGEADRDGFLASAVRGFFENGGEACHVVPLQRSAAQQTLERALESLLAIEEIDLLCAPDLLTAADPVALQQMVLAHCDRASNRFAILDSLPGATLSDVVERQWRVLTGKNAALYFPWVVVATAAGKVRSVPACGHIAGVFARSDAQSGVFKAPANELVEGVLDLDIALSDADHAVEDPYGVVNCLRAFRGRGVRIWGARTISGQSEWKYVNVRRLFLTVARWLDQFMADIAMEPNTVALQGRIRRELNEYLYGLFRKGALQGASPQEAYFVRCGSHTTNAADREAGRIVAEVGIAPAVPNEFVMVRLVHSAVGGMISANSPISHLEEN